MSKDHQAFPSGSNLGAIVARMQERAVVVTNEEDELQRAKESLELIQREVGEVSSKRREVRAAYLQRQVDQNKAELRSIRTTKEIELKQKQMKSFKQQTAEVQELMEDDLQRWESGIQEEVALHRVRQQLYLNYLHRIVTEKEASLQQCLDKLALVRQLEEDQKLAIQRLREQGQQIRMVEIPLAKERHGEANAHVETLAKRVREAIEFVRTMCPHSVYGYY